MPDHHGGHCQGHALGDPGAVQRQVCLLSGAGSQGYPKSYETGYPITIPADLDAQVFVAGAKLEEGVLKTSGGRVLGVTAVGDTLQEAIDKAYREGAKVTFENAYYRKDIGARALRAKEEVK